MEQLVCDWCGSTEVVRDAWAAWDAAEQAWTLATVYDDGFCHRCECARPLSFEPMANAAAA